MVKTYLESFKDEITAVFSSRKGGISAAPYSELNLGLSSGDNKKDVKFNRERLFKAIGYKIEETAFASQTHSDHVEIVTKAGIYPDTDALITNCIELPLTIQVADCSCVFLYDPIQNVIAAIHSGWKGTAKNIVEKTILKMQTQFQTNPKDIHAAISASLSQENFEVGRDVYDLFNAKYFRRKNEEKWLFDMKQCLVDQLSICNVQNIYLDNSCTYNDEENYFSYRRDREKSGRMMGIIVRHKNKF